MKALPILSVAAMSLGVATAVALYSPSVEVSPQTPKGNAALTRRDLEEVIHRLADIEAKLASAPSTESHSSQREQVNVASGDRETELRLVYEKLVEIENVQKQDAQAIASNAHNLQVAMQGHNMVDPATIDGVRSRFGSQDSARKAFLFHSQRQLIEMLGPPNAIGVREHGVEEWTYNGRNGKFLKFFIHNGVVFNAWM